MIDVMPSKLLTLTSPVFVFIATFKRKVKRGETLTGDELHDQIVRIFRDSDQRAQVEAALSQFWERAKKALVYLVDEVMTTTEWEYRGWWSDHSLERQILGNPQKMRGILFFDELEETVRQLHQSGDKNPEKNYLVDLLTIFYCCLRFGFEGKFAGQPQELKREADDIFALLPHSAQLQPRVYFDQAYRHTVEIPPQYETVMRLVTLAAIVVGMTLLFWGFREILANDLLSELRAAADRAGSFFSQKG